MVRMTMSRFWQVGLMAGMVGAAGVASAQETIKLAEDRQVPAQADTRFRFDLPKIPQGKQVRLCLDARIEWGSLGGSTGAMNVHVNDKGLVGRHLVNKPLVFSMRNDWELAWGIETGCGYRLVYSPDFSDRLRTDESYEYGIPDTDPFRFVWDVTSYVRTGGNEVRVFARKGMAFSLRLRAVAVEIGDPLPPLAEAAPQVRAAAETTRTGPLPVYVPKGPAEIPAAIGVSTAGSIRFSVGKRDFNVRSRTSLPKGEWSDGSMREDAWSTLRRGRTFTARWTEVATPAARWLE